MGHILENKSLGFLLMILLLGLIVANTGLIDYIRGKENFTDTEKEFMRSLVKNEEGNGAATIANNNRMMQMMGGESGEGGVGADSEMLKTLGEKGGMDMSLMRNMKSFLNNNKESIKNMMSSNHITGQHKEQFTKAVKLLDKLNI
jgi:hypothetical protein